MSEAEQLALRFSVLSQQVQMMVEQHKSDHDLIIEIHTLLSGHVNRFEEHIELDDKRETEALVERRLVAERLLIVDRQQTRVLTIYGLGMAIVAILMRVWK